jgi:hypothetical protein
MRESMRIWRNTTAKGRAYKRDKYRKWLKTSGGIAYRLRRRWSRIINRNLRLGRPLTPQQEEWWWKLEAYRLEKWKAAGCKQP